MILPEYDIKILVKLFIKELKYIHCSMHNWFLSSLVFFVTHYLAYFVPFSVSFHYRVSLSCTWPALLLFPTFSLTLLVCRVVRLQPLVPLIQLALARWILSLPLIKLAKEQGLLRWPNSGQLFRLDGPSMGRSPLAGKENVLPLPAIPLVLIYVIIQTGLRLHK